MCPVEKDIYEEKKISMKSPVEEKKIFMNLPYLPLPPSCHGLPP
jgi:hypothetical protein